MNMLTNMYIINIMQTLSTFYITPYFSRYLFLVVAIVIAIAELLKVWQIRLFVNYIMKITQLDKIGKAKLF